MSKLLINENPLVVLPTLAKIVGLQESIILQQVQYWISNEKSGVFKDGHKWVHNSYAEWADNFPFWSASYISKIILGLEKSGLLISDQFAPNPYDHTKSYRIDYEKLDALLESNTISTGEEIYSETTSETTNNTASDEKRPLPDNLPVDWQIAAGVKEIKLQDQKLAQMKDAANLISMGCGSKQQQIYDLAWAFMQARDIVLLPDDAKVNRKFAKQMATSGVQPHHIVEAVHHLISQGMTIVKMASVAKTAISLANPTQDGNGGHYDYLEGL